MSYILDALRRADAERERGAVPGLHAKPLTIDAPVDGVPTWRKAWVPMAVGSGIALVALVGLGWWLRPATVGTVPQTTAQTPGQTPAQTPGQAPAAAPTVIAAAPPPVLVPPPQQQPPVPAPAPAPAPAVPAPPPVPAKPRIERPARPDNADTPAKATPAARPERTPPKPAAPPAPPATPLAQLPSEARAQLPPMTVGGSIYSDSPASRFVMINGQIVREGEPAATGVVLERIGPKSAVLRWREWRIEVPL